MSVASEPPKFDKPLSKTSLPKSGGHVPSALKEPPKIVDEMDESEMDTSGGNRKRKPSDDKDLDDLGPLLPQRPSRSVTRTVIPGRHSGLPAVSPARAGRS